MTGTSAVNVGFLISNFNGIGRLEESLATGCCFVREDQVWQQTISRESYWVIILLVNHNFWCLMKPLLSKANKDSDDLKRTAWNSKWNNKTENNTKLLKTTKQNYKVALLAIQNHRHITAWAKWELTEALRGPELVLWLIIIFVM